jgi:hypothetical protein
MTFLDTIGADGATGEDFPEFLSRDNKVELATSQHPIFIVGGTVRQEGKFEPQTFYTVKFGTPGKTTKTQTGQEITVTAPGWAGNSDLWTLALTANDERETQMQKIKEALSTSDVGYIGPCFLHATKTRGGNDYWKIRGVRDENPQAPSEPSNGASTPQNDGDDSIPFAFFDSWGIEAV